MKKSLRARAHELINTSVQDMQSGLWAYGVRDLPLLKVAFEIASHRSETTKAKVLNAKIKKLEKQNKEPVKVTVKAAKIELSVEVEK